MKDGENKILHPKSVDSLRVKRGGEGLKDNNAQYRGIYAREEENVKSVLKSGTSGKFRLRDVYI